LFFSEFLISFSLVFVVKVIKLGRERFRCPEILFQPYHLDPIRRFDQFGIHEMIYEAIMDCEITERRELWANILLAGGSTCFKGLPERIKHELAPHDLTKGINVIASPDRKFSAFMGACMVASHSSFPQLAVSKEKYTEGGANELAKFSTEFKE
jgi:actin-related protein